MILEILTPESCARAGKPPTIPAWLAAAAQVEHERALQKELQSRGRVASQTLFLVDGYNLIAKWSGMAELFFDGALDAAREKLNHQLVGYAAYKDVRMRVVYDSAERAGSGPQAAEVSENVAAVFAEGSADSLLEAEVRRSRAGPRPPRVVVVTSDDTVADMCRGLSDVFVYSAVHMVRSALPQSARPRRRLAGRVVRRAATGLPQVKTVRETDKQAKEEEQPVYY